MNYRMLWYNSYKIIRWILGQLGLYDVALWKYSKRALRTSTPTIRASPTIRRGTSYSGQKKLRQPRMPNYTRVHARESTRLCPGARGCLNFFFFFFFFCQGSIIMHVTIWYAWYLVGNIIIIACFPAQFSFFFKQLGIYQQSCSSSSNCLQHDIRVSRSKRRVEQLLKKKNSVVECKVSENVCEKLGLFTGILASAGFRLKKPCGIRKENELSGWVSWTWHFSKTKQLGMSKRARLLPAEFIVQ